MYSGTYSCYFLFHCVYVQMNVHINMKIGCDMISALRIVDLCYLLTGYVVLSFSRPQWSKNEAETGPNSTFFLIHL